MVWQDLVGLSILVSSIPGFIWMYLRMTKTMRSALEYERKMLRSTAPDGPPANKTL